ncbi:hypothetical protein M7963_22975 [Enterobacter roggenkampii]|uniref:hypothetical protein n=1 Tax=Enterobacter roggenkampii TaxID=1812935 RepID=UPI0022378BF1|nr:hypothetical protein [Enterobacter roggenkampii]MCW5004355.1 hypothetical protein [Enterobacter roggenkampii]
MKINKTLILSLISICIYSSKVCSEVELNFKASISASNCVFDITSDVLYVDAGTISSSVDDGFYDKGSKIKLELDKCQSNIVKGIRISGDVIQKNMWRNPDFSLLKNNAGTSYGIGLTAPNLSGGIKENFLRCKTFESFIIPGICVFRDTSIESGVIEFRTGILKKTSSSSTTKAGSINAIIKFELELE